MVGWNEAFQHILQLLHVSFIFNSPLEEQYSEGKQANNFRFQTLLRLISRSLVPPNLVLKGPVTDSCWMIEMKDRTQWWDCLVLRHSQKRGWSGFASVTPEEKNAIYRHLKHHLTINIVYMMILSQNQTCSILNKHNSFSTLCWMHWIYNKILWSVMRI